MWNEKKTKVILYSTLATCGMKKILYNTLATRGMKKNLV